MMNKNDQISIKGYRWAENPRNNNKGGGVGILISEKIAQNTIEDNECEEHEHLESKWIRLECRPKNIAIGVFYGPQENEKIDKVQEIYSALNNQINQQAENNEIIIAGDFNAKLAIDRENCSQPVSRNGKILTNIITDNNLITASLQANHGTWTRVNRQKTSEKSVIDYVLTTPQIAKNIQSMIVDEDGSLRVKGKKESDHNTIVMSIKINDSRQPTYKQTWKINNTEGWKKINVEMKNPVNKERIEGENYKEAEKTIKHILNNTIGTRKVRTDKTRGITNERIKAAKKAKKEARHKFNQACKNGTRQNKQNAKKEYLESQTKLRTEIEKAEAKLTEEKLGKNLWKLQNQPQYNLGSKKKGTRMQHPRLQHRHRRRKTNYRPNRKQRTHSKLLWRTIPGQGGDWRIQGMDWTDHKNSKNGTKKTNNPPTKPRGDDIWQRNAKCN